MNISNVLSLLFSEEIQRNTEKHIEVQIDKVYHPYERGFAFRKWRWEVQVHKRVGSVFLKMNRSC
jgi:hypothetical protein